MISVLFWLLIVIFSILWGIAGFYDYIGKTTKEWCFIITGIPFLFITALLVVYFG